MDQVIKLLTMVAEELDINGYKKIASTVDEINNNVLDIKLAQYVGVQGYWIRNTRCFNNCYRQKRATSPKKATWEVWSECHREYLESINDDETSWNKYADSESNLVKDASVRKSMIYDPFVDSMRDNLKSGNDIGVSIVQSIDEQSNRISNDLLKNAKALSDVAGDISNFDKELSEIVLSASINLLSEYKKKPNSLDKEAQFFQNMKDRFTGRNNPQKTATREFANFRKALNALRSNVIPTARKFSEELKALRQSQQQIISGYNEARNVLLSSGQNLSNFPGLSEQDLNNSLPQRLPSLTSLEKGIQTVEQNLDNAIRTSGLGGMMGPQQGQQQPVDNGGIAIGQEGGVGPEVFPGAASQQEATLDSVSTPDGAMNMVERMAIEQFNGDKAAAYKALREDFSNRAMAASNSLDQVERILTQSGQGGPSPGNETSAPNVYPGAAVQQSTPEPVATPGSKYDYRGEAGQPGYGKFQKRPT